MTLDQLVIDDYEARFREYEDKVNNLAADLLEERAQRREVAEALVRVTEERDELRRYQLAWKSARLRAQHWRERHRIRSATARRMLAQRHEAHAALRRTEHVLLDVRDELRVVRAERDEARDEVVRLGRERDTWKTYATKRDVELERLRTIIVELGAGEAAESEEQIGCPSCHTILNARAAGGCGDTWHWENRQQPEEQIEALRPEDPHAN